MYSGAGLALSIPMIKDVSFGPLHSEQFEQTTRDALEVFYRDRPVTLRDEDVKNADGQQNVSDVAAGGTPLQ